MKTSTPPLTLGLLLLFATACRTEPVIDPGPRLRGPGNAGPVELFRTENEPPPPPTGDQVQRPNFVVVVIESLHEPTVAALRDDPSTAPTLARLMREGRYFSRTYAQSGWTMPGLSALLTGQFPTLSPEGSGASALQIPDRETLPGILELYGYTTAAVWGATLACGFTRGLPFHHVSPQRCGRSVIASDEPIGEWLDLYAREPFFVLVHNIDLHTPEPSAPVDYLHRFADPHPSCPGTGTAFIYQRLAGEIGEQAAKDHVVGHYRGQLAYYDEALGRMLERLDEAGMMENTVVVVTTNHGQDLFEHSCFDHGLHYDSVLHIPLIWWDPRGGAGQVDTLVQTVDIAPSILARAEIPRASLDGASLLPLMGLAEGDYLERDVYSVTNLHNASLRTVTTKLVLTQGARSASCAANPAAPRAGAGGAGPQLGPPLGPPHYELYDLVADPGERNDLWEQRAEQVQPMVAALDLWLRDREPRGAGLLPPISDKARRALNEGGYWDQVDPTPGRPHGKTRPPEGDRARKRNTEGR